MQDFKKLKVWEKSHALALEVYKAASAFPRDEVYGLTSQMRRSATSVPSNIAEGCGRDSILEMRKALRLAMGSASELEYQLLLSRDLGYLASAMYENLNSAVTEAKRMLASFIATVNRRAAATDH